MMWDGLKEVPATSLRSFRAGFSLSIIPSISEEAAKLAARSQGRAEAAASAQRLTVSLGNSSGGEATLACSGGDNSSAGADAASARSQLEQPVIIEFAYDQNSRMGQV